MVKNLNLSYIIATKNKLPYLKIGLEKLIANKKEGEEILVADGASTDGTKEYIEELERAGKIDFYISEPDYAESHALNKLFLKAQGEVIKIINDDDAYYFPVIEKCKNFMITHPEIDIMGMEGGSFKHETPRRQVLRQVKGYKENYLKWKKDKTPFEFAVLGLMFRRSSLPLLGFWDLSFKNADAEYTFRATASKAKLAWCLSPAFVFIRTKEGVTMNNMKRMHEETLRLRKFYLNENQPSKLLIAIKRPFRNFKDWLSVKEKSGDVSSGTWRELYDEAEKWLIDQNKNKEVEFLS
ncbi:hypothetical protein COT82_00990 [Candidatus Campbellbacteria bacterium CG10_big_fil_rev_8_21_14_0_10_35_52]|uniref:Glycosyltransferase 2-like domain-containing protein n=1 Tax=Candidatus Campbellbacteria bacterium CG10_big_fil_rev_8_21_14_0_10_35_52 TaxID=1974527 RepID=A0A2M6WVI9_9BACT|nr:MAG: hypothetical protein COT82_00990 [Candidatus Campbellbacteria bacterium CG10_big_fil_rev_8_21_14_0_10_35_52]